MLTFEKRPSSADLRRLFCMFTVALVLTVSLARYGFVYYGMLAFTFLVVPLSCITAGGILFDGGCFKSREFRILLAFFLWAVICALFNEQRGESLLNNQADLSSLLITVFVCFPLAGFLGTDSTEAFLRRAAVATVACIALFDVLGTAVAFSGRYLRLLPQAGYGIGVAPNSGRLQILCHPNSVGMIAIIGISLAFYLLPGCKKKLGKVLLILSVASMYVATVLASARTSTFAVLVCFGLLAFQLVWNCRRISSKVWRAVIGLCAMLAVALSLYGCSRLLIRGANLTLRNASAAVSSAAPGPAEADPSSAAPSGQASATDPSETVPPTSNPTAILERDFSNDIGTLNNRTLIWRSALDEMKADPATWVFGVSPGLVEPVMEKYPWSVDRNLHNVFVQVLFSTGCIGLLLFIALLVVLFLRCWKLFFSTDAALQGKNRLPILLAGVLVLSCMESFLLLYPDVYFANVWFFLIAGWICRLELRPSGA